MKRCYKCGLDKPLVQFSKNKAKKDGLSSCCKDCNKAYQKEHYQKNKKYYMNKAGNHGEKIKQYIKDLKEKSFCRDCGENHPACLVFHHINPEEKELSVSLLARNGWGMSRVKEEISKCIILCANCHRKLHYNKRP